jgi:chorismate synthase
MTQGELAPRGFAVREPVGNDDLRALEDLQVEVWGFDERDAVPASHFRAVHHVGGMVLCAYLEDRLIGFAYGFPALPQGAWEHGVGLHSHMVGVGRGRQGTGVGRALKWAQRDWCLARDIPWMNWTFDPIQARNARLNFHHLGVRSREYLVDFYGTLAGSLGGNQTSDRLMAFWDLQSRDVTVRAERYAAGLAPEPAPLRPAPWCLRRGPDGEPLRIGVPVDTDALRVAVPADANRLLHEDPEAATRWRTAVREAMAPAIADGFVVTAFESEGYLLERGGPAAEGGTGKMTLSE